MHSTGARVCMSKRWSGRLDLTGQALDDENNRLLLEALRDRADRRAHYVCAAAYADGARELVVRGEVHGRMLESARGAGGFGYDPYFWSDELGKSFGEATREEKAAVSHRARAFAALLDELRGEKIRQPPVDSEVALGYIRRLAGRSVAWYRACFGSRRSPVQIRAPRPGALKDRWQSQTTGPLYGGWSRANGSTAGDRA